MQRSLISNLRFPLSAKRAILTAALASLVACSGDSSATAPGAPAALVDVSGNAQIAPRSAVLPLPLTVRVTDASGKGIPGETVTFEVVAGGGALSASSVTTGSDGTGKINWTLGALVGTQLVQASFSPLASLDFTATATAPAGVPATIAVTAGANQVAMAGTAVPVPPTVTVKDGLNNPVAGATVNFSVASGGGSVTGQSAITNAAGTATVGSWTLGSLAQPNALTISTPSLATATTATGVGCEDGSSSGYTIVVCYVTPMTDSQHNAFHLASLRWGTVITGKLPDINPANVPAGNCGTGSPAINIHIDDLLVLASIAPIDGLSGTLAQSGTCSVRVTGRLTVTGRVTIDATDAGPLETEGHLDATVLHEVGHVLGIGSLWPEFGLLQNPTQLVGPTVDTYYSGANGLTGFAAIGGAGYTLGNKVPVENTQSKGPGSYNSHWRESVLFNELMTPTANIGLPTPLSELTIRSLADLGYVVNPAAADPFSLLPMAASRAPRTLMNGLDRVIDLSNDVDFTQPLYTIDPRGRMTRIR